MSLTYPSGRPFITFGVGNPYQTAAGLKTTVHNLPGAQTGATPQSAKQQANEQAETDRSELEKGLLQTSMQKPGSKVKNSVFTEGSIAGIISGMAKE